MISILQPEGPGIAVSVVYFDPLPVTPPGNTYILIFTGRFSRRVETFVVIAAEFNAEDMANISSTDIFPSGDPRAAYSPTTASSLAIFFSNAVYQLSDVLKVYTSSCNPSGNGGMGRVAARVPSCQWS